MGCTIPESDFTDFVTKYIDDPEFKLYVDTKVINLIIQIQTVKYILF
jgi:hypothetical protein